MLHDHEKSFCQTTATTRKNCFINITTVEAIFCHSYNPAKGAQRRRLAASAEPAAVAEVGGTREFGAH
jgi:hypothetical protein